MGGLTLDGACHRVAPGATAFAYRDANFATVIAGMWPDPAGNQDRIHPNYRGNYERLATIERRYDPANLFHLNQNLKP